MVIAIIFALYILQANGAIIPTPIWVLAWVLLGLKLASAIVLVVEDNKKKNERTSVILLLKDINRKVK